MEFDKILYTKLVKEATTYLKRYKTEIINGKTAEDFAMECMINEKVPSIIALKRNIIDEARVYWGRSDRGRVTRKFTELTNSTKSTYDPPSTLENEERIKDFLNSLPITLKSKLVDVALALVSGKKKNQIAKELNVSATMVTHLVNDLTAELAKDSEWRNKLKIFQNRNPSSSERRRTTQF